MFIIVTGDFMIFTVTLNPALDYYMKVGEISADVQQAESTYLDFGGKGINVSVMLQRLGVESRALGFVGGFSGSKLLSLLENQHIDTDFVTIQSDTRINVKLTGAADLVINTRGPSVTLRNEQELIQKLKDIKDDDYLVLAGSIPSSMGESAYDRIVSALGKRNIRLIVDTTGNPFKSLLGYHPFLVKPNHHELADFFGRSMNTRDDIVGGAMELQRMGAENVLVSMGKQGMLLLDGNGEANFEPIIDGKVRNTTGCGDSTVAGFLAGYIRSGDYRYALRLASVCGNATAFCDRLAGSEDINRLLQAME